MTTFNVITPPHGRFHIIDTTTEAEWKAARRLHITATDAARLATLRPSEWRRIRQEKAGDAGFGGNRSTDWGHAREPHIIDYCRSIDPTIEPNHHLIVSSADARWAATPDAISDDGLVTAQAKTSNHDLDPANPGQRYYDQCQWEMLVTGAQECIFAVEEHDGMTEIIGTRHAILPRDPARQAELVAIAERFLGDGPAVAQTHDEQISEAIDRWASLKELEKQIKADIKAASDDLHALIGTDAGAWSSGTWQVKQTASTTTTRIDTKAIKADFPEIAEKCSVTAVTPGKLLSPTRIDA